VEVNWGDALTIEVRQERGYPVVTVAGNIDIASVLSCGSACSSWPLAAICW
jgi:hypothetical protein